MVALIASLAGALILAGIVYDIARLITPDEPRRPPLARLRGRRAALEEAERWLVGLRLHHRVDADTYQHRMSGIARGQRRMSAVPTHRVGGHHG
ncbi:hypothetical protein Stsp02_31460 [Streptomyces sp. NBRC 14336]|uniref:hypothetical protein n=1 Tax=Streptomyces TaxID=1883 RepID=UPI0024A3A977|nr:hypothetical protein [Streptomyces sp. NBRC 14336]GLW47484.1 hypothetical protein Stsp02_31460 [Streptomyces sp. NBRC 14336]